MKHLSIAQTQNMEQSNFSFLAEPWAITKEVFESVFYQVNADNGIDFGLSSGKKTREGKPDVINNIAVVPVKNPLYRFSYDTIKNQIKAALHDASVKAIVLRINSPGGLVAGCKELSDFIHGAGKKKNIYAYADGNMCSAAYWIGSAARDIAAPVTASIGSIGVRTIHIDWSGWNKKAGLNFTHLAAGTYKTLGNEDEPLNNKAKEYFQSRLDSLYTIFIDSVARNRGMTTDKVKNIADGKIFLAAEAMQNGLIERVEQDFESYFNFILTQETKSSVTLVNSKTSETRLKEEKMIENNQISRNEDLEQQARAYSNLVNIESASAPSILKENFGLNNNIQAEHIELSGNTVEDMAKSFSDLVNAELNDDGLNNKVMTVNHDRMSEDKGSKSCDNDLEKQAKAYSDLVNV